MPATPGLEGCVNKTDYLKLTVEASNSSGLPLLCRWSSDGGAFTQAPVPQSMRWDAQGNLWTSTWSFRADPYDTPGHRYSLTCEVTDTEGRLAVAAAGVTLVQNVEVRTPPFMVTTAWPMTGLYSCNTDGTDLQRIPIQGKLAYNCSPHPDGNTICFDEYDNTSPPFRHQIWSVQKDGSGLRALMQQTTNVMAASYSDDGTQLAVAKGNNIYILPACGNVTPTPDGASRLPPRRLNLPASIGCSWNVPHFNHDGTKVVFEGYQLPPTGDEALFVYNLADDTCQQITPFLPYITNFHRYRGQYCRDGVHNNTILGARTLGPASLDLFLVEDTGFMANYRTIASPTGNPWTTNPSPTRDGLGFVFSSGSGLYYSDMNFVSGATANLKQLTLFPTLQSGATLETW